MATVVPATAGVAPLCPQGPQSESPASADAERYRRFGLAIDAIRAEAEARVGADDLAYVRGLDRISHALEVAGRVLIFASPGPVTFLLGVGALAAHKQLQAAEIGHTVLHGAFDRIEGAEAYRSTTYRWDIPIDEESWRRGHNLRHHQYTNVAGRDPDIHFGFVRLTPETPHRAVHRLQAPLALALLFPNFTWMMNAHFTGLIDVYFGNGRPERFDFIADRSPRSVWEAHRRAFRKYVPYYAVEYGLYPLLAGPLFPKVLLGNALAETARNVYSAATIFCGHAGEEVASYPEGTRAPDRGRWYAMQAEAAQDFEVPHALSVLCGALDLQIEHHLFPRLPTNRLREVAPAVRAACEAHGVRYRSDTWWNTLRGTFRRLSDLGRAEGPHAVLRDVA